ncbi:MAG: thioesterase family protein [Rhodoblastus sp.]
MSDVQFPLGLRGEQTIVVGDGLTVPSIAPAFTGFADMPPVFATAYMVGFVEWTCVEALRPYLGAHQRTVGTHVDMSHAAATPVGMRVSATVELVSVEGRKLRFKVECRDEVDVIGSGFHERAIIDFDKFMQRVQRKGGDA